MRTRLAALGFAIALTPAVSVADPPAAAPPAADPALVYYPVAAKAAGIEGAAVIRCARNAHMALRNCVLVSETPAGQGFGAAALAMAAQSPDNPRLDFADEAAKPPQDMTVRFTVRPLEIKPDVTHMAHMVDKPVIVTQPSDAQIQAAYPARALDNQIEGAALMDCTVLVDGKLAGCRIAAETPTGYGFGQAALDLAGDFAMKPRLVDGEAVSGAPVRVGISFRPGDPEAPLTLGVKPAKP